MMRHVLGLVVASLIGCASPSAPNAGIPSTADVLTTAPVPDSVLRHVVLFKWVDDASATDVAEAEAAFNGLPAQIEEIRDYEWGLNNSPEGLDKGFTHVYFLTFADEAGRAAYLPHPAHVAFTELVGPLVADVTVVDYWARGAK